MSSMLLKMDDVADGDDLLVVCLNRDNRLA